jgi:hypothetical protein
MPNGKYEVAVHIPDVPNLATAAPYSFAYGQTIVNQANHRGSWKVITTATVTDDEWYIQVTQHAQADSSSAGCERGNLRVAFDAVRVTRL